VITLIPFSATIAREFIRARVQLLLFIALGIAVVVIAIWIILAVSGRRAATHAAGYGCEHCREAAGSSGERVGNLFMLDHRGGLSELYQCMHCGALWEGGNNWFQPISAAHARSKYADARAVLDDEHVNDKSVTGSEGIDPASGSLITAQGRIEPIITKSEMLASAFFHSGNWTNEAAGWYAAQTQTIVAAGEEFACTLRFHFEDLHSVELMNMDPLYGTSWDDYSLEKEAARNQRHEQWLNATIGRKRAYRWGKVWCNIDTKGGFAGIWIHYNRRYVG
jgi:hypothetical protein